MIHGPAHFQDEPLPDLMPDWDHKLQLTDIPFLWLRGFDTLQIAAILEVEECQVWSWRRGHAAP